MAARFSTMLMGWDAFHGAHVRPYIVFADLEHGRRRQTRFELLASLANIMNLRGDYALLPDGEFIRVVFELEDDARVFAEAAQARKTAREGGWAGQWWFLFDAEAETTVKAVPPSPPKRRAKMPDRAGGRPRRLMW